MTDQLAPRPCPFCGNAAELWREDDFGTPFVAHACPLAKNQNKIEAWNTRPLESALEEKLREAEAKIVGLTSSLVYRRSELRELATKIMRECESVEDHAVIWVWCKEALNLLGEAEKTPDTTERSEEEK